MREEDLWWLLRDLTAGALLVVLAVIAVAALRATL
jgi:hypothetical protein